MAVGTLTDTDTVMAAAVALGGYMAPFVVRNVVQNQLGVEVPDEAYGAVVALLVYAMPGQVPMSGAAATGSLVFAGEAAAERLGVKGTVTGLGA